MTLESNNFAKSKKAVVLLCALTMLHSSASSQPSSSDRPYKNLSAYRPDVPDNGAFTQEPAPRNQPVLVYDIARRAAVLFGGYGSDGRLADTWLLLDSGWVNPADTSRTTRRRSPRRRGNFTSPPARGSHAMTYDTGREKTFLFGGSGNDNTRLNDTWVWDGFRWQELSLEISPPVRSSHQITYDPKRRVIVLYGGSGNEGRLGDTWELHGTNWRQVSDTGPPARRQHVMVYDEEREKVILFGGSTESGRMNDLWEWDGVAWNKLAESGPGLRDHHAMVYDKKRKQVVLFGGWDGSYLGDTWTWDSENWEKLSVTGPSPRAGKPAMIYDERQDVIFLYGGGNESGILNDLWKFDGSVWLKVDR